MKRKKPELLDEYLSSLEGTDLVKTGPFFYSQVRNKMDRKQVKQTVIWRPAFVIAILFIFLFINFWMIQQQNNVTRLNNASPLQSFAQAYDFNVSSY
jgi:hypothetical protein